MRQVDSKYHQFPIAFDIPEDLNRIISRNEFKSWKEELGLRYNYDYIGFTYRKNDGSSSGVGYALAFKDKAIALLFKLRFS
jgi:hypothetical protein